MGKTAIILGATGLTGSLLLEQLLVDQRYDKVILFSRRSGGFKHSKMEEYLVDMLNLDTSRALFFADEVFCCIGTTKAKTPNEAQYTQIDFGIPVTAAKLCKENNINTYAVVSALGADKDSKLFYNRTKGEMETAVLAENIPRTYILQPSLIGGHRKEKRMGEYIAKIFMTLINSILIGSLKQYRSIDPLDIAKAMVVLANGAHSSGRIVSDEIKKLVTK